MPGLTVELPTASLFKGPFFDAGARLLEPERAAHALEHYAIERPPQF
jgi:hypothetical protein